MVVRDYCIYCILLAVPTLPFTYLLHQQGAGVLGDLPSGNSNSYHPFPKKKFHVPFVPWQQVPCDGKMELCSEHCEVGACFSEQGCPGYRSHTQEADCFGAKYFLQEVTGKGGEVILQGI